MPLRRKPATASETAYWADFLASQRPELVDPAGLLAERLNASPDAADWHNASRHGVELVDHPDSHIGEGFHLANGDVVYPTAEGWTVLQGVRTGARIRSGDMDRIHNPGVDPTARIHRTATIDPTARIEAGASIGPHTTVGKHAHVGRGTSVGQTSYISAGAFIGTDTAVGSNCIIGDGAVIGAGSYLGTATLVGHGAYVPQQSSLDATTRVANHEQFAPTKARNTRTPRANPAQLAHAVERLLSLDAD